MYGLEDAIKAIREECKKHEYCTSCLLRKDDHGRCALQDGPPNHWKLHSENKNSAAYVPKLLD